MNQKGALHILIQVPRDCFRLVDIITLFRDTIISKCLKISIGVYKFFYNSESGSVKNRVFLYELKMLQRAGVLLHTIKSF